MKNNKFILLPKAEKIKFYRKLHQSLARKYGTKENHFSHKKVSFIRESHFRFGLNKNQTIKKAERLMYRPHHKRNHKIAWYLHLCAFLKNCPPEVWEDITQEAEYGG